MRATVTVLFGPGEDHSWALASSVLRGLGVQFESSDADGRRWIQVVGGCDDDGIKLILNQLVIPASP